MKSSDKIAFFDSGVGGLTVLKRFKALLPNEDCLYFGDLKNNPYGEKSKDELIFIADNVFKFLETKNVKAVVMACNTTSANTYEELKNNYNFKMYPIIQSCAKVISQLNINNIGVFATAATINSEAYSRELKKYNEKINVFQMSCPPWVKIVEQNAANVKENQKLIKVYLDEMLKNKPEKIILGCTHYPFLLEVLEKFSTKDLFIDPAVYFAEFIKQDMEINGLINSKTSIGNDEFYVSANPESFKKAAQMFYNLSELPFVADV